MTMTRCGLNPAHFISVEDLSGIGYFNMLPALSHLGAAISDMSEMMLREVNRPSWRSAEMTTNE